MTDQIPPSSASVSAPPTTARTHSLYRKYRPQTFETDDLVGQEHIVRILRNAIRLDRISHAYLFCGPRGTGKTTTARLLAKAVNCLDPDPDRRPCNMCANCVAIGSGATTDVIEIDAASNRGIDDIRDLRDRVKYAPVQLQTKFYIVDEAHQITGAAANAFLKTLEEPPAHTKFILATTDPEELLPTIVSRCQRFDFRRIGYEAAMARLRTVALAEGLLVDDGALDLIARQSTGSLRDGLSLLDQLALYVDPAGGQPRITVDMVRALLGISRNDRVEALATAIADRNVATALRLINAAVDAGEDPRQINRQLVTYLRQLMHHRAGAGEGAEATAQALAERFELGQLAELSRRFSEIDFAIKTAAFSHLPLEIAFVQAIDGLTAPARELQQPATVPAPAASPERVPGGVRDAASATPALSLRDRVRGATAPPAPPAGEQRAINEAPGAIWPASGELAVSARLPAAAAPVAVPPTSVASPFPAALATDIASAGAVLTIDQVADLWPRVRQDVKAINRRIEALLASADPARVTGDTVILAAAYPFHRDKLNTDDVRQVLESVLTRIGGRPLQVTCKLRDELRDELPAAPAPSSPSPAAPAIRESDAATTPEIETTLSAPPAPTGAGSLTLDSGAAVAREADAPLHTESTAKQQTSGDGGTPALSDAAADEQRLTAVRNIFDAEIIATNR